MIAARPGLPYRSVRGALRLSTLDGALASVYGALTGGVFLTGFALRLGANELLIGFLASLPLLAAAAQLGGAYLMERAARRRAVCLGGASTSRWLWLLALALPPLVAGRLGWSAAVAPWALLAIAAASQMLGALGGVAWLSWMADLVPIGIRGRYFGSRNLVCGIATALATVLAGWYLDRFPGEGPPWGFATLFVLAVLAGWGSVVYLRRIPDPPRAVEPDPGRFRDLVRRPFRDANFRRLVRFGILWNFSVFFAAPFFTVFMLDVLRLSYVEVAFLTTLSTVAHLVTIRGWGRLADQYGNRPVMLLTGALVAPVPLLWMFVGPGNVRWLAPAIHLLGGAAWAGHSLAASNLLLRLAPRAHDAVYFSTFAAVTGLGSAVGPILAGLLAVWLRGHAAALGPLALDPFLVVFACSFLGRGLTILLLRPVVEPRQASVREVIRMLSTVRGFNTLMGVDILLMFVVVTLRGRPAPRTALGGASLPPPPVADYTGDLGVRPSGAPARARGAAPTRDDAGSSP